MERPDHGGDGDVDKKGRGVAAEEISVQSTEPCTKKEYPMEMFYTGENAKKKSVYIVMNRWPEYSLRLLRIDPHDDTKAEEDSLFEDMTPFIQKDLPPDFANLKYYTAAALDSKLYLIGGYYEDKDLVTDQVSAFNVGFNRWDNKISPMKLRRDLTTALVFKNKIFVFGYDQLHMRSQDIEYPPPLNQWAEVYDPESNEWNFLDAHNPPPKALVDQYAITITAVNEEEGCMLFCVQGNAVYGYNISTNYWFEVLQVAFTPSRLLWSNTVATLGPFLFWHYFGSIYAYAFVDQSEPSELFTIPGASKTFGFPSIINPGPPEESFLVSAGNGVLCLVYRQDEVQKLAFHKFELQFSPDKKQLSLHRAGYDTIPRAESDLILTVLVM